MQAVELIDLNPLVMPDGVKGVFGRVRQAGHGNVEVYYSVPGSPGGTQTKLSGTATWIPSPTSPGLVAVMFEPHDDTHPLGWLNADDTARVLHLSSDLWNQARNNCPAAIAHIRMWARRAGCTQLEPAFT